MGARDAEARLFWNVHMQQDLSSTCTSDVCMQGFLGHLDPYGSLNPEPKTVSHTP